MSVTIVCLTTEADNQASFHCAVVDWQVLRYWPVLSGFPLFGVGGTLFWRTQVAMDREWVAGSVELDVWSCI